MDPFYSLVWVLAVGLSFFFFFFSLSLEFSSRSRLYRSVRYRQLEIIAGMMPAQKVI